MYNTGPKVLFCSHEDWSLDARVGFLRSSYSSGSAKAGRHLGDQGGRGEEEEDATAVSLSSGGVGEETWHSLPEPVAGSSADTLPLQMSWNGSPSFVGEAGRSHQVLGGWGVSFVSSCL